MRESAVLMGQSRTVGTVSLCQVSRNSVPHVLPVGTLVPSTHRLRLTTMQLVARSLAADAGWELAYALLRKRRPVDRRVRAGGVSERGTRHVRAGTPGGP